MNRVEILDSRIIVNCYTNLVVLRKNIIMIHVICTLLFGKQELHEWKTLEGIKPRFQQILNHAHRQKFRVVDPFEKLDFGHVTESRSINSNRTVKHSIMKGIICIRSKPYGTLTEQPDIKVKRE